MKKSEMVKIIEDIIIKYEFKDKDEFGGDEEEAREYNEKVGTIGYGKSYEDVAKIILEEVCKAGMIPPTMEFKMGNNLIRDNGWESENA